MPTDIKQDLTSNYPETINAFKNWEGPNVCGGVWNDTVEPSKFKGELVDAVKYIRADIVQELLLKTREQYEVDL